MWKRQRFDCDEDEDEDECEPFMEEFLESSLTLKNLFDLQGNSLWGSHESYVDVVMIGLMRDTLVMFAPFVLVA
jgi:hypothetical protein